MNIDACFRMGTEYGREQIKLAEKMQVRFQAFGNANVDEIAAFVAGYAMAHPEEVHGALVEQMTVAIVHGMRAAGMKPNDHFADDVLAAAKERMKRPTVRLVETP
jgi:hypothetical protein